MNIRKLIQIGIVTSIICSVMTTAVARETGIPGNDPEWKIPEATGATLVDADAAILIDSKTGRVLYAKNARQQRPQASTTKITTAILALESGKLDNKVKVSKTAADTGEAAIWLEEGEELTLRQLLYALMLYSANDAAVAIAQYVGGTEEAFINKMNEKAKAIDAKNTHYVNPHGLDAPQHYSSAYDLAMLARYGMWHVKGFRELVSTYKEQIPWAGHPWKRVLYNRNKLLKKYPGADGVKTGTTEKAGKCLVASATRKGQQFIAVVLDSPDPFRETELLLNYGFANYQLKQVISKGQKVKRVKVQNGLANDVELVTDGEVFVCLEKDGKEKIVTNFDSPITVEAPVQRGQDVGEYRVLLNDKVVGKVNLITTDAVERKSDWQLFREVIVKWFKGLFS